MARQILINIILIVFFTMVLAVILLPFAAGLKFQTAMDLEKNYRWAEAETVYRKAILLNPLDARYPAGLARFFSRQIPYSLDRSSLLEKAEDLYKRASLINKSDPAYCYYLGTVQLDHALIDQGKTDQARWLIAGAVFNFKEAVKKDQYNPGLNYSVGYELLKGWNFLEKDEKEFAARRLTYAVRRRPWYAPNVYAAVMYYTGDFNIAQDITPDTLEGYEELYSFALDNNLLEPRARIISHIDFLRKKDDPAAFEKERTRRKRRVENIKEDPSNTVFTDGVIPKGGWKGTSEDGKHMISEGRMYWGGTVYAVVEMKRGGARIIIQAKKELIMKTENPDSRKHYPYMVVELDGRQIGETFADSSE
ncbi:MAG: hypothetical protein HQ594_07650 [Candidatus Omnitrophica bacterium]|nr:hypothetical protein [Candidatus Omnitrophota bacterium]